MNWRAVVLIAALCLLGTALLAGSVEAQIDPKKRSLLQFGYD